MSTNARDQLLDELSRRVALLEGWRDGQEKFQLLLRDAVKDLGERLAALEAAVARQDQRWEARFQQLDQRWEARFQQLDQRWETRFLEVAGLWERRSEEVRQELRELGRRFWWLMAFQFTVLLAVVALLSNLLFKG